LLPLELFAAPAGSRLDHSVLDVDTLTVVLATTAPTAVCPRCGSDARRVHSRYNRWLADLPCFGRAVRLKITVRRFSCPVSECPRRIFAERLPGFAAPHARTTDRLHQAHEAIGLALGGEAGSRLTIGLSMTTSPDTLLRRVKELKSESAPPPRFVGIDDWAWCKGQRYGTLVVDLERGDVVDLLPDRDAETVKTWLKEHPGVELISRDRWSAYAQAAADAAPEAQQVADRWHLLKNLREAIERLFERQSAVVGEALKAIEAPSEPARNPTLAGAGAGVSTVELSSPQPPSVPAPEMPRLQARRARRQRRVERFEQVHQRHGQGHSVRRIAREMGMSRDAVRRYLRCETCPDWNPGRARRSRLDAHREWIDTRLAEGGTNAVALHRQLTGRGYRGSYGSVRRYVTKRLGVAGKKRERINAAKLPVPPPPSAKQLPFEWVRRREDRKPAEQARLDALRAGSDELAAALDLADEFAELVRNGERLESWRNLCTQERNRSLLRKTRSRSRSPSMSSAPQTPEKQAEIEDLAQAIREAVDAEIGELAANLAQTDDVHLFGENEFKIRALAHKIAAKAIEQHLTRKKTDMKAPA
jgi:Transposase/zinc-finger of transposase IS204/IS1001/IS1096/IS1165